MGHQYHLGGHSYAGMLYHSVGAVNANWQAHVKNKHIMISLPEVYVSLFIPVR